MKTTFLSALVAVAMVGSLSTAAFATPTPVHTITSNETLTATVVASCIVTQNGQLAFPEYKPNGVPFNSTSADIAHTYDAGSADAVIKCTPNTNFDVTVPTTHRNMTGTAHGGLLPYTYNVLGSFSPVGSPPHVNCPFNANTNHASGVSDSLADPIQISFGGCIEPGLWPAPDTYTDSFTFTVSFF